MKNLKLGLIVLTITFVAACSGVSSESQADTAKEPDSKEKVQTFPLEVFKSPTCGCCGKWVTHVKDEGFDTKVRNYQSIAPVKKRFGIPSNLQSCHTSVSQDGYFFEGHIPAKFIRSFLDNPPEDAAGLAVPGMPAGSPGMEFGKKFQPYKIFLIKKDGSIDVFTEVNTLEEQFDEA